MYSLHDVMFLSGSLGIQHKGNYLAFKEERLKVEIVTGQLKIRFIELNFIPLNLYKQTTKPGYKQPIK